MRGIELARQWFSEHCLPELQSACPDVLPHLAAGLAGHGSECFGFDDEISRDHDFSAAVSLWLPEKAEARYGFRLTRIYDAILKKSPPPVQSAESLCNAPEQGVIAIEDFFRKHIGIPGAPADWRDWLYIPEYAFAEAVNGEVFWDGPGIFSKIREEILTAMPEDVRKKKIAARAVQMAQSGQYNFSRCLKHGERGAAGLALAEFVRSAGSMIFLLNRRYMPYYKWMFRAMRSLPRLQELAEPLEFLIAENGSGALRCELIEDVAARIAAELHRQNLSSTPERYLEAHAVEIMRKIGNREIRTLHLMEG